MRRTASIALGLLTAGLLATAPPGASGSEPSKAEWFTSARLSQAHWHRIARSQPLDRLGSVPGSVRPWSESLQPGTQPVAISASAPGRTAYQVKGKLRRAATRPPRGYEMKEMENPAVFPYVTHGLLAIHFPAGSNTCSGTIVPDRDKSLVLTAAHCLMRPDGVPADAVAFAPGYRLGQAPFGFWQASSFGVMDQYSASVAAGKADVRFDVGAVKITPDSQGVPLGHAFGSRGITFDRDWNQTFSSFGYPVKGPFEPGRLYRCRGTVRYRDSAGYMSEPFPLAMRCEMTAGSSGAGWVTHGGMVNSVTSYVYENDRETHHGPYFGAEAQAFYEETSGVDVPALPEDPASHRGTLSLSLSGRFIASGSLESVDGYAPCTRAAPVRILRRTPSGMVLVKRTMSDHSGRFRVGLPERPGTYQAVSPKGFVDDLNVCAAVRSSMTR